MKYPKEYLDEIKNRLKVSTVVSKTVSLKADTSKAKKTFNFRAETNLEKIISILMENDLNLEMNKK